MNQGARWLSPVLIAVLIVAMDRISKALIRDWLPGRPAGPRVDLVGDWLGFQYVENRGAAFGTLSGYGGVLTALALVVVLLMVVLYARVVNPSRWHRLGLGLLVGGAVGNVLDRIDYGYVVDFVAVGPWPRFNVADSAITIGVLLLAWRLSGDDLADAGRPSVGARVTETSEPMVDENAPRPGPTGSNPNE